jgi:nucleoside-diphosphate-sugar epimerase
MMGMNVLIVGATGYVGTAVDEALSARGHRTSGSARSAAAERSLKARGTALVACDASRPQSLIGAARNADAVVYAVSVTDADAARVDGGALRALTTAMAGSGKPFVYVSSAWVYGDTGGMVDEGARLRPPAIAAHRPESERLVHAMSLRNVRATIVRPGIVYGRGGGIPAMFVHSARERRSSTIVGKGTNRWATIEVRDLGELIALALEAGSPGRIYNAVDETAFTQREIAEAASRGAGAGAATTTIPAGILGPFGEALVLDQRISARRAKNDLGWAPGARSILEDLESGSYQATPLAS